MRLAKTAALVLLGVFLAGAAALHSWPIDAERVRAALDAAIGPAAGLHWRPQQRAFFTLLPMPTLRLLDVELLDGENRSVLDTPVAEIGLSPSRLLGGGLAPISATLTRPTMLIDLDTVDGKAAQKLDPRASLPRIEIHDGAAKIVSVERRLDARIENIDGWLDWREIGLPLRFSFAAAWRGEKVAAEGRVDAPLKLRDGDLSGARIKATTPLADVLFEGTLNPSAETKFDGTLTMDIRTPGAIGRWLGFGDLLPMSTKEISLNGKAVGGAGSLALDETELEIGGQRFDGSLSFAKAGSKMSASGTLAASMLDVGALLGGPPNFLDASEHWSGVPIIPEPDPGLDLDLRVSASHATWGGHTIDDAAAALEQRDGRLTLKLIDGTAYQGSLSGEASIQRTANGLETTASGSLAHADLGALVTEWGASAYSGAGGMEAKLHALGASPAELAASLSGTATLELQEGAIAGVNFEEALRRSQRRPVDLSRDMTIGQTKFESARVQLEINDGQARIVEAQTDGPGAIISAEGVIDVVAREWRTKIHAIQAGALGAPSVDAARLTLAFFGPWASPTVVALTNSD
jgi:AsmA protein